MRAYLRLIACFVALVATATFAEATTRNGVTLDPERHIRPALLAQALAALETNAAAVPLEDRIGVVDYDLPSTAKRFFVVDLKTGAVEAYLTAHGRGSDPDHDTMLDYVSDDPASGASSAGAFLTGDVYCGQHGKTLLLYGLDKTNANAFARQIVVHTTYDGGKGTPYMTSSWLSQYGAPGRSCGCFVIPPQDFRRVVDALGAGRLLFAGATRTLKPTPEPYPPNCAGPTISEKPEPGICAWPDE